MGFIKDFFSGGIEGVGNAIGGILDQLHTSDEEKAAAALQLETLFASERMAREESFRAQLEAKQKVLVAELSQSDSYTKRARPTVVYFGLILIGWNYGIAPYLSGQEPVALPVEFYAAGGGICATWAIGRTREKLGQTDKVTAAIVGK
jgi:hypothetical protein